MAPLLYRATDATVGKLKPLLHLLTVFVDGKALLYICSCTGQLSAEHHNGLPGAYSRQILRLSIRKDKMPQP